MKICWQLLADHPSSCGWLPQCPSFLLMDFCSFHPCHFVWPGFLCPSCIILHFEMLNSGTCPFVQLGNIYFFLLTKNRFHYLLFVNKNCLLNIVVLLFIPKTVFKTYLQYFYSLNPTGILLYMYLLLLKNKNCFWYLLQYLCLFNKTSLLPISSSFRKSLQFHGILCFNLLTCILRF